MKRNKAILILFVLILGLSSCQRRFFPNVMFKEEVSQVITDSSLIHSADKEYVLQSGDKISFKIYSNKGFVLVDQGLKDIGVGEASGAEGEIYTLDKDGFVRLPILDKIRLSGKSIPQAEKFLEEKFSTIIQDPFVKLRVESWRVFVFKGLNGAGTVIPIEHQNTSLLEIIAESGGIPSDSKAFKIKIIRGSLDDPEVYIVDASSLDGLRKSNIQVLSNDIIYIEPSTRFLRGLVAEVSPYASLVTMMLVFANLVRT